jgi:hypothetical protein
MKTRIKIILIPLFVIVLIVLLFIPLPVVYDINLIISTWELKEVNSKEYDNLFKSIENIPFELRIKFGFNWCMGGKDDGGRFGATYSRNMLNQLRFGEGIFIGSGVFIGGNQEIRRLYNERRSWLAGSIGGKCYYKISNENLIFNSNRGQLIFKKSNRKLNF